MGDTLGNAEVTFIEVNAATGSTDFLGSSNKNQLKISAANAEVSTVGDGSLFFHIGTLT